MTDKKWCEHYKNGLMFLGCPGWFSVSSDMKFCPICGTPRPEEKRVELPKKWSGAFGYPDSAELVSGFNQLIDYLASKPWESQNA